MPAWLLAPDYQVEQCAAKTQRTYFVQKYTICISVGKKNNILLKV